MNPPLAIDAHVHLHDPAAAVQDLRAARDTIRRLAPDAMPVVMLTERRGWAVFDALGTTLEETDEPEALWLRDDKAAPLLVLAGCQVVTAEGLEVSGLCTRARTGDGLPVRQVLTDLQAADAVSVIPWGAGKWTGRRGRLVDDLMAGAEPGTLFLGDNGGRPRFWKEGRFTGRPVLPGSDPLPLAGYAAQIGRFGFLLSQRLDVRRPAAALRTAIRSLRAPVRTFGGPQSAIGFVSDQTRLRLPGRTA